MYTMTYLGDIPRASTAAIGDDVPAQAVGRVRALQHSRQLRITNPGLLPRGADGPRPDADLDDVGPGQDELLHHLAGDHVAGEDGVVGELGANLGKIKKIDDK